MALMIAPTLLDGYDWLNKCPASWKQRAYDGLRATLAREFTETPETKAGNAFEAYVYANANVVDLIAMNASENFKKVCQRVRGMLYQAVSKKFITIDGEEYLLYNRIDALGKDDIVDIKTTGNYRGANSYLEKWQHRFNTFSTGIPNFTYCVSEWEQGSLTVVKDVHMVDYFVDDFSLVEAEIVEHIREFMRFVESDKELERLYYTVYNKYGKNKYTNKR